MIWLWAGVCLLLLSIVTTGEAGLRSLDRFNDEDVAEFGEEPQKPMDRGILMDRIFNKKRMQPGNAGTLAQGDTQVGGNYGAYANTNSGFQVNRGGQTAYGLNYGSNNAYGGNFGGGMNGAMGGGMGGWGGYNGPYAGPPMFIQPAMSPAGGGGGGGPSTTADPDATTADPEASTEAGASTTMKPIEKAEAIVRAFGGGEAPRIQQMGAPIIIPMDQVPPGLSGMGKLGRKPIIVKPGEQMPMYGKIVLGPPKFAQAVDMSAKGGANANANFWNKNSGGLTLVRYNKPNTGINYNNNNEFGGQWGLGGSNESKWKGGFRSMEPYEAPPRPRAPPVIKYVPVIETVRRKRMKGILVDPV